MIGPLLLTWIEQWHFHAGFGVFCSNEIALMAVANGTAQPEVRLVVRAAAGTRHQVLDFQRPQNEVLRTETISAAVPRRFADAPNYIGRWIITRHGRRAEISTRALPLL